MDTPCLGGGSGGVAADAAFAVCHQKVGRPAGFGFAMEKEKAPDEGSAATPGGGWGGRCLKRWMRAASEEPGGSGEDEEVVAAPAPEATAGGREGSGRWALVAGRTGSGCACACGCGGDGDDCARTGEGEADADLSACSARAGD